MAPTTRPGLRIVFNRSLACCRPAIALIRRAALFAILLNLNRAPLTTSRRRARTPPLGGDVTRLLERQAAGEEGALESLVELVYDELCAVAHRQMRREAPGHTLDTRALVNEAYIRFLSMEGVEWRNRGHFFGVAGLAMKQILLQHARAKMAAKRGGGAHDVPLDSVEVLTESQAERLVLIDQLLGRLERIGPRYRQVVEHKVYSGLTLDEIAEALEVSRATVKRAWAFARAWLNQAMVGQALDPMPVERS